MRRWLKPVEYVHSVTSSFDPFDPKLKISTLGLHSDVATADAEINRANKPGYVVGYGLKALIVHEFGHAIDHFIRAKGSESVKDDWFEYKRQEMPLLGYPSPYSRKNMSELFAELFTLETTKRSGKLIKTIDTFMHRVKSKT